MDAIVIKSMNWLVNLDARFSPARDYTYRDDEDYDEVGNMKVKEGHDDAWLDLRLTSTKAEEKYGVEGELIAAVAVSRVIRLHDAEAEALWSRLMDASLIVSETGVSL